MLKHLIVLPDGTEIASGGPGAAVAACLQLSLLGDPPIRAGDSLELRNAETRQLLGIFLAQEPVRSGSLTKITAYDRLILLDRPVDALLQRLQFPVELGELARHTCEFCGLTLQSEDFPNGEYSVPCPTGDGISGRQLLSWIAQAAGCFCRATATGTVELGWKKLLSWRSARSSTACLPACCGAAAAFREASLPAAVRWQRGC